MKPLIFLFAILMSTAGFAKTQPYFHTHIQNNTLNTTLIQKQVIKNPPMTVNELLTKIVHLAETGEVMNFKQTIKALNIADFDYQEIKPNAFGNRVRYTYHNNDKDYPLASITHEISFGGLADDELVEVGKQVTFSLKPSFCPSIDTLKKQFGEKLWQTPSFSPPSLQTSLQTGQGVQAMDYSIHTDKYIVFIENHQCEFVVVAKAKFE